ncbi:MAG: formyl transferase [Candidatus Marinimicrobia bacterium]|nr:formyl transferase [Candidatus Neomarinimicrobiota bacterium]
MRIVFIGSVKFSKMALEKVHKLGGNIKGICTLKESSFNADFCDLTSFANSKNIPCKYTKDINSSDTLKWIKDKSPDVIFCFGFSRLLGKEILNLPALGVIGYHPAELPKNRGRHPLIWALVLGLKKTASTFLFLDEGADNGDILSQSFIEIDKNDDAGSLYKKVSERALIQIEEFLPKLILGNYSRIKQNHELANTWRKRGESDGKIDWRMDAKSIHNLVRGLTKPYVGAHFLHSDKEIKVWKTQIIKCDFLNIEPGKVMGIDKKGCLIIKCGKNSLKLIKIEPNLSASIGDYL